VSVPGSFLDQRLDRLIGAKTAKVLAASFGIHTADDLLRHYPRRYVNRGQLTDLSRLHLDEHVTVLARVRSVKNFDYKRPRDRKTYQRTEVVVTDGTGQLLLTFFRQPYLVKRLPPGAVGLFAGKVTEFRGRRQLTHPDYTLFPGETDDVEAVTEFVRHLIPVYPATALLPSWRIAQSIEILLDGLTGVEDPLPQEVRRARALSGLADAFEKVHRPESKAEWVSAQERLRFEEAFVLQVVLAQRRLAAAAEPATPRPGRRDGLLDRFGAQLPFALTTGQQAVGEEIAADLRREHPMHRLLQGEVGSGKTVVALRAMLQVIDSGGQAALLAPTEVLAQQHARSIADLLGPMVQGGMLGGDDDATGLALLTGSAGAKARKHALLAAASGAAGVVVGTHALLEEHVQFAELGLVVVDEQHRFGVEQRAALLGKAGDVRPHVLVMTATPIPRTIAMTVFGDLDVSVLAELPAGRSPIQTTVVPALDRRDWLDRAWERVTEEVGKGHQAYVVCPRIGDDLDGVDEPQLDEEVPRRRPLAVNEVAEALRTGPLQDLRLDVLHGRLAPDAKDAVMSSFAAGRIDVLVSTTVVEVGVDVPNASLMVVMDAERFGVSQLHQLRGRVGRGAAPGLCLLVTEARPGSPSRARLDAIAATNDGFELSEVDLRSRREGDLLGAAQSGRGSRLRLLSVIEHADVIADARAAAEEVVGGDPGLTGAPGLAAVVRRLHASQEAEYLQKA
jgi:ATP-dependent DNA helicase RecG